MEQVLQQSEHSSSRAYDATMANRLVAQFDLQGHLHILTTDGLTLDVKSTIKQLADTKRLPKEIAIVWVPTQQVMMTQVQVPGKRKAHWQAAFPYALEETLTQSIDDYHLVAFNRDNQQQVAAAVVSLPLMQQWQTTLAELGLQYALLVADCFRIPWLNSVQPTQSAQTTQSTTSQNEDNESISTWLVASLPSIGTSADDTTSLVRTSEYQGFAANTVWMSVIKEQFINSQPAKQDVLEQTVLEKPISTDRLLSSHQTNLLQLKKVSLSQGAFAQAAQSENSWYEWRWVGVLSLLVCAAWLGMQAIHTQQIERQALYTQQQSEKLFKTFFPEVKRVVNIKSQTITKLKQGGQAQQTGQQLTPLLQAIEPLFKNNSNVSLTALSWQPSKRNALVLQVKSNNSKALEELANAKLSAPVSLRLNLKNVTSEVAEGEIYVAAN